MNPSTPERYPPHGATDVNPDVQLRLAFSEPPVAGSSGTIRIYDAADDRLVDELDMSIPPGPTERASGAALTAPYLSFPRPTDDMPPDEAIYLGRPYPYDVLPRGCTNANTKPGTSTAGAKPPPEGYQLTIIGEFTDGFHFYPIIVDGTTAIIQLHHNLLEVATHYYVEMDPEVIELPSGTFEGFKGRDAWRFSTTVPSSVARPGARRIVVSADGTGDFDTVQGAIDSVPPGITERVTILVRAGVYHEIVYFRQKRNITIQGEARGTVRITYANNEVFNPHPDNLRTHERPGTFPSRRATFTVDNCNEIHLVNLVLETTCPGQAEGLLITGYCNILDHVDVIGAGDALQVNGPTYLVDSSIRGTGDTILGRGPAFFDRCTLTSTRVFMWIRNTDENHGNIFRECTFVGNGPEPTVLARAPKNNVSIYPWAEVVLIDCTMSGILPRGWGPSHDGGAVRFWEYRSRNPDGTLVDVSKRVPWSRQLDADNDAEIIRAYSDPSWVLDGWVPLRE